MLYVFHGSDHDSSLKKAQTLLNSLRAKKPDAAFVRVDADSWNPALIEENLGGQGLFSNKYIVFIDRVGENSEAKEKIVDFIPAMNESTNIFIVLEGKLNVELKKDFEKHAEKVVVSDEKGVNVKFKKEFNIFALGDALGDRNALKAWSIYREAVDNGLEAENVLGTLFWQAKSIAIAQTAKSGTEAGLNPFVFGKSKRYGTNYSMDEINKLVSDLVILYHNGHRGLCDLELSIEKLLLNCGK